MSDLPNRKSIRLKNYDYSQNGMYYVTICTHDRAMLFGEVVGADLVSARVPARMNLNNAGKMIESIYHQAMLSFTYITSEKYIIMPNHLHCILRISNIWADKQAEARADTRSAPTMTVPTLGALIQAFKSKTTVEYINGVKFDLYPQFNRRIWQRNYYEHIIRNEEEYRKVRQYIEDNPAKWEEDKYYIQEK